MRDIMFGMVEGTDKKGRTKREWLDDIKLWCQETSIYKLNRHDRDKWSTVVKKASSNYVR